MDSHSTAIFIAFLGFLGALAGASIPAIIGWIVSGTRGYPNTQRLFKATRGKAQL
jgi:hypothetical protein